MNTEIPYFRASFLKGAFVRARSFFRVGHYYGTAHRLRGDSSSLLPHFARLHYAVLDFRETWRSINAPTFPLNVFGSKAFHVLGVGVGEIPYLVAVAAFWYLVGYFCERQRMLWILRQMGDQLGGR